MDSKKVERIKVQNKDALERMNYLYQLAYKSLDLGNEALARFYIFTMTGIAKRLAIRLDPSIKRTICKYCNSLLVAGITMRVRISPKRETHVIQTCLYCGQQKRFLARDNS